MVNFFIIEHVLSTVLSLYLPCLYSAGSIGWHRIFWWKDFSLRNVWLCLGFQPEAAPFMKYPLWSKLLRSSGATLKNIWKVRFLPFYTFLIRKELSRSFSLYNTLPLFLFFLFCFELKELFLLIVIACIWKIFNLVCRVKIF